MVTTRLSSKGQVVIPKHIRDSYQWKAGTELRLIAVEGGILLKPNYPFAATTLDEVAGCLRREGPAKSDAEISEAMEQAARKAWRDRN